jgi:membrane-bound serine protease (ClpP class)
MRRYVTRIALGLIVAGFVAFAGSWFVTAFSGGRVAGQVAGAPVYRVHVTGVIELGLAPYISRSIAEARAAGARMVVLEIETPGGRVDAAEQIVDAIKEAGIPVYAYINRRAFSAGALIALATDEIYMREGAVIGAATPVTGDGERAPEKIVSAMRSEMRALAEARGLDPQIAAAMVDEDIEIPGVVEAGKLLTLTTEEAVRIGYAQFIEDWDALVASLGAADAPVVATRVNWAERIVRFTTHPLVAPMLLSLGFLGLLFEIKTPTFGIAGLVGASSLALFFGSHYLVGLAGMEEVLLLIGGLALLAVELFLIPGFGIAGAIGLIAVLASLYMTMLPGLPTANDMAQTAGLVSLSMIVVLVVAWALVRRMPYSPRFIASGIVLGEGVPAAAGEIPAAGRRELIGASGVALTDLRPSGSVRIGEDHFDVVADSSWIPAGSAVRVVRAEGSWLVVRTAE